MLAIVSHDLRSPLNTIALGAEILMREPEVRKTADVIERAALRMDRLIGDLLDASAINANSGKLALDVRPYSAAQLVHEAVDLHRTLADAASLELAATVCDGSVEVTCDRERILQVFSNLIGNALKFTPKHGTVEVTATVHTDVVRFEVRDTGCGIAPDQIPHLFERFWRAENRRGGAGLGLFIANGIIVSHGSTLVVDSTPGGGTTFGFVLPRTG